MATTASETTAVSVDIPIVQAPPSNEPVVQETIASPVSPPAVSPPVSTTTQQPFGSVTVTFNPPPPPPPPPPPSFNRPAAQGTVNVAVTPAAPASGSKMGLVIGGVVIAVLAIAAFVFLGNGASKTNTTSSPTSAGSSSGVAANQPTTAKDELNILLGLVRDGRWKEVTPKIQQLKSLSQVSAGNRKEATTAFDAGQQMLNENNLQGAIAEFEKAIASDASFGSPRFSLARSYARNGKLDVAANVLVDGLLITPDSGDGWLAAAEVFAENGKDEAANASLKLALHLAQNRSAAMQFLGSANETIKSAKFKKLIETALPTLSGVPSK